MSVNYAWEKFLLAVLGMAESSKSLQERLADAYISSLSRLTVNDLPPDDRFDFERLEQMLTRRAARDEHEGTVHSTTSQMSVEEAEEAARLLVSLFDRVSAAYRDSQ